MTRDIEITALGIFTQMNACAHSCRYCNMADKRLAKISRDRFMRVVERFIRWCDDTRAGLRIAIGDQYSGEEPLEVAKLTKNLRARTGYDYGRIHLGGLKIRSEAEIRIWMRERFEMGNRFANASYAGIYEIHDHWNRRHGDFQYLLRLQTIAAETGMDLGQYMFISRSTFPYLEALLDHLELLPKAATERFLIPFNYIGWAREYESERILEEHREMLPDRLRPLMAMKDDWRSEREWMNVVGSDDVRKNFMLRLDIDETNIEYVEATACEEIFEKLMVRTRAAYQIIPTWDELRDRYGDKTNMRVYANQDDIERKWLDLHLKKYSIQTERKLTHLAVSF